MIRLLSSDLDGTLLGDRRATQRFRAYWEGLNPATRPFLVRLNDSGSELASLVPKPSAKGKPKKQSSDAVVGGR